jgi:hypothetical protein
MVWTLAMIPQVQVFRIANVKTVQNFGINSQLGGPTFFKKNHRMATGHKTVDEAAGLPSLQLLQLFLLELHSHARLQGFFCDSSQNKTCKITEKLFCFCVVVASSRAPVTITSMLR